MKKIIIASLMSAVLALALTANAADEKPAKKDQDAAAKPKANANAERTIAGKAVCAKCTLSEGEKCQVVIQANRKDKEGKPTKVSFYLADNEAAKAFGDICAGEKQVVAVGKVKKEGDKMILTASKIEEGTRKKQQQKN